MPYTFAVTLESMTRPPVTARGIAECTSPARAASIAIRTVKAENPGRKAASIVVVLHPTDDEPE